MGTVIFLFTRFYYTYLWTGGFLLQEINVGLLGGSLVVFAITLTVTKATILECKRQFVEDRYKASWIGDQSPGYVHWWWHAMWSCPMCLGFWVAAVVAPWFHCFGYIFDVLILFGLNWLIHCAEEFMFQIGNFLKKIVDEEEKN